MNRENLEKLAHYLYELPEYYQHFHMGNWNENSIDDRKYGCYAVGQGAYIGLPIEILELWHDSAYQACLKDLKTT